MLSGLDHMKVEVQDCEQVEVREKVEARETEEDKTRKQQTLKQVMTCAWTSVYADTPCDTLSHNVVCSQGLKCPEKLSCEVYLSTETSPIRCSWALLISPISCIFRIWVFRRTFLLQTILLVVELLLVWTQQIRIVRPVTRIFALPFVVVVHRRTCWGTRHEALASPRLISPDWASDPCCLQKRDPLKFDGLAFLNTELLIRFPCSDENHPRSPRPSDDWDLKLSFPAWVNCALTYLSLSCTTNASGFSEAFWAHSGEVSIFCSSPSSRSESAMLSAESSKCMCDWKWDVSVF